MRDKRAPIRIVWWGWAGWWKRPVWWCSVVWPDGRYRVRELGIAPLSFQLWRPIASTEDQR